MCHAMLPVGTGSAVFACRQCRSHAWPCSLPVRRNDAAVFTGNSGTHTPNIRNILKHACSIG
jgi:hypothetical protein